MTYAETVITEKGESYTRIVHEDGPKPPPEIKRRGRKPKLNSFQSKAVTGPVDRSKIWVNSEEIIHLRSDDE